MIMYVSELVIFSKEIYYFYILLQPENDTRDVPRLGLASTSPRQPSQVEMCTVPGFIVLSFFSLFFFTPASILHNFLFCQTGCDKF